MSAGQGSKLSDKRTDFTFCGAPRCPASKGSAQDQYTARFWPRPKFGSHTINKLFITPISLSYNYFFLFRVKRGHVRLSFCVSFCIIIYLSPYFFHDFRDVRDVEMLGLVWPVFSLLTLDRLHDLNKIPVFVWILSTPLLKHRLGMNLKSAYKFIWHV